MDRNGHVQVSMTFPLHTRANLSFQHAVQYGSLVYSYTAASVCIHVSLRRNGRCHIQGLRLIHRADLLKDLCNLTSPAFFPQGSKAMQKVAVWRMGWVTGSLKRSQWMWYCRHAIPRIQADQSSGILTSRLVGLRKQNQATTTTTTKREHF